MDFDSIHWAIPGFIILLLAELILSAYDQRDLYETKDTISRLTMGLGNVIIGIWGKLIVLETFYLLYQIRIFTLGWEWYIWILAFFADDFSYYWFHRTCHAIRFLDRKSVV